MGVSMGWEGGSGVGREKSTYFKGTACAKGLKGFKRSGRGGSRDGGRDVRGGGELRCLDQSETDVRRVTRAFTVSLNNEFPFYSKYKGEDEGGEYNDQGYGFFF